MSVLSGGTPTYDPRGNLTNDSLGNAYGYNIDNQLVAKGSTALAYDPAGRLATITGTPAPVRFDYDGTAMVAESIPSGTLTRRYVHGPGTDEPLLWYEGSGTTDRRWLGADERGSITAITDGGGNAVQINAYDENGVPAERNTGRFGYTGQAWLPEVGLSYYKARMYAPALGRFLQSDPIGYEGGMNMYAYVRGDPVNYRDPSGTKCYPTRTEVLIDGWTGGGTSWLCEDSIRGNAGALARGGGTGPSTGGGGGGNTAGSKAPQNGRPHRYVASGQVQCGADEAFELMRSFSAPGAPYAEAGRHDLILTGNNPITQIVNVRDRTILNVTRQGHTFFPGTVGIAVGQSGSGAYIAIVDKGTTPKFLTNTIGGYAIFQSFIQAVRKICSDIHSGPAG